VLTYLVTSLSQEVLTGVANNTTAVAMWVAINKTFASQSRSRILHLCNQLVATKKGKGSVTTYFSTMRGYTDEMAAPGKPLDDDDIVSYIINGLDADYNSLIEQVNGMAGPTSPETLYSHLLDTEVRLASQKVQRDQREQYQLMANVAAHGNNGGGKQYTRGGHQGNHGGHSRGGGCTGNPNNPYKNHQCDICGKLGHSALRCWKRFDKNFNRPTKSVHATTTSYDLDPFWYADSAATDHIMGDIDKLTMKENYGGQDQVHTANGVGMMIKHIGQSTVSTPTRCIFLNNGMHVPQATHNLASVHHLTTDNNVFLELYPDFFLLRIGSRSARFCTANVEMGSILFHLR
jgi:hypothetical protein